jgi:hypothetical protein
MVSGLTHPGAATGTLSSLGRVSALCLATALPWASPALAQDPDAPPYATEDALDVEEVQGEDAYAGPYAPSEPEPVVLPALGSDDAATEERVASILSGSEFREFEDARSETRDGANGDESWFSRLLEAIARWLRELDQPGGDSSAASSPMPVPPTWLFVGMAVVLLIAVLIYLGLAWRRETGASDLLADVLGASQDPRERAPEEHLDEAAQLAAQGLYREAFRSLYLATLVALDRHREIDFDPARTNWHYLRQMGPGARAASFRTFTGLFDRKWYGDENTTQHEYERGRALATALTVAPLRSAADPQAALEGAS